MYASFRQTFGPSRSSNGDDGTPICEWRIKRNCSLTPRQSFTATAFLMTVVVSVGLTSAFSFGVWLAVPFSLLCVFAILAAFIAYSRHATDGETLRLAPPFLIVEVDDGGEHFVHRMNAARLTVFLDTDDGASIYLCDGWQRINVGRQLPVAAREEFARQLRSFISARAA